MTGPRAASEVAVVTYRGDVVETRHQVSIAVADPEGRLVAWWGDPERLTWLRSANKPFQALMTVETGAVDRFGLTPAEVALISASHSAEDAHVDGVLSILGKLGLDASALHCGAHPPMHEPTRLRVGSDYNRLHSDCSGKHAGMLALALHLGDDPAAYLEADAPSQRLIREAVAGVTGVPFAEVCVAVDGCGAPTFAVPLRNAAMAYARLATGDGLGIHRDPQLRIRDAMMAHPWLVAGTGRLDTALMQAFPNLVTKGGAQGFEGIGVTDRGLGLAAKIEDGNASVMGPLVFAALKQLDVATEDDRTRLGGPADLTISNFDGTPTGRAEVTLSLRIRASPGETAVS